VQGEAVLVQQLSALDAARLRDIVVAYGFLNAFAASGQSRDELTAVIIAGVRAPRTSSRDFANRQVCATVNSLGTFAVAFQVDSNLPAISGLIVDPNGAPLSGVIVNLSGSDSRITQTDSNGVFKFVNLTAGGNYNVQPKDSGVLFVQPSEDVSNLNGEQTLIFTATPAMFEVSGHVQDTQANALEGVEIAIEGFAPTVTDSSGNYSFTNIPAGGPYFVSAFGNDLAFSSSTLTIDDLRSNQSQVNFVGQSATAPAGTTIQLSSSAYSAGEGDKNIQVTIDRTGDTSSASTVDLTTSDLSASQSCSTTNGTASSRCDYQNVFTTLHFAAGETAKTFSVLLIDDAYLEGQETFSLTLSNPNGAQLGANSTATLTIVDNEIANGVNPVDVADFSVRQHYLDFFTREPDPLGFAFWTNQITQCGADAQCVEIKRINVSAAFYLSIEFQETGYLVERMYKAAYGDAQGTSTIGGAHPLTVPIVRFNELLTDTQQIGFGVVVGQPGWEQVLEDNKVAFSNDFVQRARFTAALPQSLTPTQFVDQLNANAGNPLSTAERDQLIADLTGGTKTRAQVLRAVAEDVDLKSAEFNRAFVLMQYFGYLRRNPNDLPDSDYTGYDFWLTKLNQFNGNFINAEMVKAFLSSIEYRQRFGP